MDLVEPVASAGRSPRSPDSKPQLQSWRGKLVAVASQSSPHVRAGATDGLAEIASLSPSMSRLCVWTPNSPLSCCQNRLATRSGHRYHISTYRLRSAKSPLFADSREFGYHSRQESDSTLRPVPQPKRVKIPLFALPDSQNPKRHPRAGCPGQSCPPSHSIRYRFVRLPKVFVLEFFLGITHRCQSC